MRFIGKGGRVMDMATISSRFEHAKAKLMNARSLRWGSGNAYQGPVQPAGIVEWQDVAPDSPERGQVCHYLVVAEHVPRQHWLFGDDGSYPPDAEVLILAELDGELELAGWDEASRSVRGLMSAIGEHPGGMEMLTVQHEKTRNFRYRILFNALRSVEEQDRALAAARQRLQEVGLPQELQRYVDVLCKTEDPHEFREAAFGIWEREEPMRKHLPQLSTELVLAIFRDIDPVGSLWICRQFCAFDCPPPHIDVYAVLLCQQGLNPPLSEVRRTLQWAAIEGLMQVTSKLSRCGMAIVEAIGAELALKDPYSQFIEHAIYVLGSIGSPDVRQALEQLQPAFPAAVSQALENYGQATPAEIKAKAQRV
jgi:hypothetical protein